MVSSDNPYTFNTIEVKHPQEINVRNLPTEGGTGDLLGAVMEVAIVGSENIATSDDEEGPKV